MERMLNSIMYMTDGIIGNNNAYSEKGVGGGVYFNLNSEFNMLGGNIINNSSENRGGAIGVWNGSFNLENGTISNNYAIIGGGIWISGQNADATMIMMNGKIINNTATNQGGGVYLTQDSSNIQSTVYLKGGIITNNTAPTGANTYVLNGAQFLN